MSSCCLYQYSSRYRMRLLRKFMGRYPEHTVMGCIAHGSRSLHGIVLVLALFIAATPLSAQVQALTRPVNLATLARRAEVIVQGRVISARQEPLPGYPNIRTVVVTVE